MHVVLIKPSKSLTFKLNCLTASFVGSQKNPSSFFIYLMNFHTDTKENKTNQKKTEKKKKSRK